MLGINVRVNTLINGTPDARADARQMLSLLPLTLGFSPGLVPRTSGVEQRAAVQMAAKRIALGVVGPGLVGGEFMVQLEATQALLEKQGLDVVADCGVRV